MCAHRRIRKADVWIQRTFSRFLHRWRSRSLLWREAAESRLPYVFDFQTGFTLVALVKSNLARDYRCKTACVMQQQRVSSRIVVHDGLGTMDDDDTEGQ